MILGFGVLMLVWMALSRSVHPTTIATGMLCSACVVVFWRRAMPSPPSTANRIFVHPLRFGVFLGTLTYRFVLSTLSTAWMILRGGEQGRIVALPLRVRDPFAQFVLLNSITMTPSTIALLTEEDVLYIHWLQPERGQGDWRGIKESLERRLLRVFEEAER
jgi:multicomponent Na+:H+ antiporter subunit E